MISVGSGLTSSETRFVLALGSPGYLALMEVLFLEQPKAPNVKISRVKLSANPLLPMSVLAAFNLLVSLQAPNFIAYPYLQLGRNPGSGKLRNLSVVWHTEAGPDGWGLVYGGKKASVVAKKITIPGIKPYWMVSATMQGLSGKTSVEYSVTRNGSTVFSAKAKVPPGPGQSARLLLFGDTGRGLPGQKKVMYRAFQAGADLALVSGDIVYPHGRMSEYRKYLFPYANANSADPKNGAPFMRSVTWVAAPGNHDVDYRDLGKYPDGLAFYTNWIQPLNGPDYTQKVPGPASTIALHKEAAGENWTKSGNFSFDVGDVHVTCIDSGSYTNWRSDSMRNWLEKDLASAGNKWKFVLMHVPPVYSAKTHANDGKLTQHLVPLFVKHKVNLLLTGHIHNYQRSKPFSINGSTIEVDKKFDGNTVRKTAWPICIVSGAGGAELYDQKLATNPGAWQPFTANFQAGYSFSIIDVNGPKLQFTQMSADGKVLDRIVLEK